MPLYYPEDGPSIIPAELTPSTLALLGQAFVFSQSELLTESQFINEAEKRGLRLDRGELEQLHRRRVLVPFYQVHSRPMTEPGAKLLSQQVLGTMRQLFIASAEGRLTDPAVRRVTRWPIPRSGASFYYSHYQLLSLRSLKAVQTRMAVRRTENGGKAWTLDPLPPQDQARHARGRALAIVLEALSSRYRPRVARMLHSPTGALHRLVNDRDPVVESAFLSLDSDLLVRQAEMLLSDARSFDPLGNWHRVTRISNPSRWDELRNDALIAQEQRLAAELLLNFVEDEARCGRAKPLESLSERWRQPQHDRLRVDQRERAETIMDFDISDRPAVYLAVEGQTEATIVANVLNLAGFEQLSSWITVIDREGVGGDVNLLARAVAVPRLDPDGYRGARVLSPLAALIVVNDPEEKYATVESRQRVLTGMIDHVMKSLPRKLRSEAMRKDLNYLLHVRAWSQEFEFAHFSNTELARGLRAVVGPSCPPLAELRQQLNQCRESGSTLKNVWKTWSRKPSKVRLAEELWPHLERRILNTRSRRACPVVDLVEDAIRIAQEVRSAREMAPDD